jgi:hypothetical protein
VAIAGGAGGPAGTRVPHPPQKIDVLFKGEPHLPQKLAIVFSTCLSLDMPLGDEYTFTRVQPIFSETIPLSVTHG